MRQQMWRSLMELRAPGMRRVLEGMRRLDTELACWDDQEQETKPGARETQGSQSESLQ